MKNHSITESLPPDLDADEIRRGLDLGNRIWWACNRPTPTTDIASVPEDSIARARAQQAADRLAVYAATGVAIDDDGRILNTTSPITKQE